MKVFLSVCLCLLFIHCSPSHVLSEGNYKLKVNNCYKLIDSNYELCLDSISDSRCPEDVVCVWQGNAAVYFSLKSINEKTKFTLNTFGGFQTDTILKGFQFSLIDVLPYPKNASSQNQKEFIINLDISESE